MSTEIGLGVGLLLAMTSCLAGCATGPDPVTRGVRYLDEPEYRRHVLEESLVDPDNGYARLRLDRYARTEGWDGLPVWNPPVRAVTTDDIGRWGASPAPPLDQTRLPVFEAPGERSLAAWIELGRRAFETYPVQLSRAAGTALESLITAERLGLSVDARGHIGGLVVAELPDGSESLAVTCATCHAREVNGQLEHGMASRFDWGALAHRFSLDGGASPESIEYLLRWGPGRVDVTPDGVDNPVAMADLRAISRQSHLHWAATLRNDPIALAIRLETLLITSMNEAVRPPRDVALALALYLWTLGDDRRSADSAAHPEGADLYRRHCRTCHGDGEHSSTSRVTLDEVGTDPAVGRSTTRGTGFYRVPSLWAVADRTPLLHDASALDLAGLLDPERVRTSGGHAYGTQLSPGERDALVRFVATIGAPQ